MGVDGAARGPRLPQRPRAPGDDRLGVQLAFDVTGDPAFPEKAAFEVARELGLPVTTHAGVWGATNDDGIRLMHENGFMTPETVYVHAATLNADSYQRIAATGGSHLGVDRVRAERRARATRPPGRCARHDIPVSLSMDTSVWWSGDLFSAMRTHARRRPGPRAPGGARQAGDTVTAVAPAGRAGRRLGDPRRRPRPRPG